MLLERPFEEEEIRQAIWELGSDKSRDLDGFSMEFFKDAWKVVKLDLMKVFGEFHMNTSM